MSESPLYDATLSDLLARAREGVVRAEQRAAEAQRQAQADVFRAQHAAARQVAEAHARADAAVREERVRRAFLAQEVEERVRRSLVDVPPLPPLSGPAPAVAEDPVEVPPVPSMDELLAPSPGVSRFLDALLGPSDA